LNERQLVDYREHRRELLSWCLNFGKEPGKADGYAHDTVYTRAYRLDKFYRFVWTDLDEGYTPQVTPEHADEWMKEVATDGGVPQDVSEDVWFWYDPAADRVVQEEVTPHDIRGLFETQGDASRFMTWYTDRYDIDDASHLQLYRADLEFHGTGPVIDRYEPANTDPDTAHHQVGLDDLAGDDR